MPSDYLVAEQWLFGILSGDATLMGMITGVYSEIAPAEAVEPFVVIAQQGGADVQEVAGRPLFVEELYQVKVVGRGNSYEAIRPAYERVHALINRQAGPVSNGQVVACVRMTPVKYVDVDAGIIYRHLGGIYRLQSR